jgi:hypothetical protein
VEEEDEELWWGSLVDEVELELWWELMELEGMMH